MSRGFRSRSIVIEVTRNSATKGKRPRSGTPSFWKICGLSAKRAWTRIWSTHGTTRRSAIVLGSCRSVGPPAAQSPTCDSRSSSSFLSDQREEGFVEVVGSGARAELAPGRRGEDASLSQQDQAVTPIRSVHDVARTTSVVPCAASEWKKSGDIPPENGVRDRTAGRVEDQELGLAKERGCERNPGSLSTGEVGDGGLRVSRLPGGPRAMTWSMRGAPTSTRQPRFDRGSRTPSAADAPMGSAWCHRRAIAGSPSLRAASARVTSPPATICTPTMGLISVDFPLPAADREAP